MTDQGRPPQPRTGCFCAASIECRRAPGCDYREPHFHGFNCDASCAYCHRKAVKVIDPENHPNHVEWKREVDSGWPGKCG